MNEEWERNANAPEPGTALCRLTELDDGGARVFTFGAGWAALEIVVVRQGDAVRGYVNRCAHLPLPLNIGSQVRTADGLLLCDHHYSAYRFSDGLCVDGACPGARLSAVPLGVVDGLVTIATPM